MFGEEHFGGGFVTEKGIFYGLLFNRLTWGIKFDLSFVLLKKKFVSRNSCVGNPEHILMLGQDDTFVEWGNSSRPVENCIITPNQNCNSVLFL